jgi:aspartate ammonia-lyase
MSPVLYFNLLQSIEIYKNAIDVFTKYAVSDLKANKEICQSYVENSYGIITALTPHIGYEKAVQIIDEAKISQNTIIDICIKRGILTKDELEEILNPYEMTTLGIAGSPFSFSN